MVLEALDTLSVNGYQQAQLYVNSLRLLDDTIRNLQNNFFEQQKES